MKGVRDALRRLEGVASIAVDLQSNIVTITPRPDVELDLAAIPAAVRRAGFTPADMELRARGAFATRDGRSTFRVRGWSSELAVRTRDTVPSGEHTLHARVEFGGAELVLEPLEIHP